MGLAVLAASGPVSAQATPFIGQIIWLAGERCPAGWAKANGQILTIDANTPLYSEIGSVYGGDGIATFALPDLRGRAPVHAGRAPDLDETAVGEKLGAERVVLTAEQIPAHSHAVPAVRPFGAEQAAQGGATGARGLFRKPGASTLPSIGVKLVAATDEGELAGARTQAAGADAPVEIRSPALAMTACIALDGKIPARK
jgi:microcystin-dependent protein